MSGEMISLKCLCQIVILENTTTLRGLEKLPLPELLRDELLSYFNWKKYRYWHCVNVHGASENIRIGFGKLLDIDFYTVAQLVKDWEKLFELLGTNNVILFEYYCCSLANRPNYFVQEFKVCKTCAQNLIEDDEEETFIKYLNPWHASFNENENIDMFPKKMKSISYHVCQEKDKYLLFEVLEPPKSYSWNIWCDNCVVRPLFKLIDKSQFQETEQMKAERNIDGFYYKWLPTLNTYRLRHWFGRPILSNSTYYGFEALYGEISFPRF